MTRAFSPTRSAPSGIATVFPALLAVFYGACAGSGPSEEDVERAMHQHQLAVSLFEEGNLPSAIERAREAIELDPTYAQPHILLGIVYHQRLDYARAAEEYRTAIQILVDGGYEGETLAESRNMLGTTLIEQGQYDEAVEVLMSSALDELNRAPHLAWGNVGWALLEKGDYDAALEALQQSIRLQPRFCLGYYRMGQVYFRQEQYALAEEALVQALEVDPSCGETPLFQVAWKLRGETRAMLGLVDEARSDLEQCIELGPRTEVGHECQAFLDGVH